MIAWFWPVFCGVATYGVAWLTGLTRLEWTSTGPLFGSWGPENLIGISVANIPPLAGFALRLVACLLFALVACLQSFGEELGWRGYLLTRLIDAKFRAPVFWNGMIWGLWHIPFFILLTPSRHEPENRWISFFFLVTSTVAAAYLLSYLRLRSGSIWPSVLAHASGNAIFFWAFNGFTAANVFWKGELFLLSVGLPGVFLMVLRPPWIVRYWPETQTATR